MRVRSTLASLGRPDRNGNVAAPMGPGLGVSRIASAYNYSVELGLFRRARGVQSKVKGKGRLNKEGQQARDLSSRLDAPKCIWVFVPGLVSDSREASGRRCPDR